MLDLSYLRDKVETLREALKKRNYPLDLLEDLIALDRKRRKTIHEVEELRRVRN